jgi:hypothetical protein
MDAVDPARLGPFWAGVLHLEYRPEAGARADGGTVGDPSRPALRLTRTAVPKTVKHRVHIDIYAETLAELEAQGSQVVLPEGDDRRWTVMADPEGGEYCAFLRPDPPEQRMHGLVVDCADPGAQARWWGRVLGVEPTENPGWFTLEGVPDAPFTLDFVPVPEPKSLKNRVYWDVWAPDAGALTALGATHRAGEADGGWQLLADPEGNEFRVFTEAG